jgi:hypothetical protein
MLLLAASAFAQSSGNFTYNTLGANLNCTLNQNGTITGGQICSSGTSCTANGCTPIPSAANNVCAGTLGAGIKTSSGNGNVFVITPAMVIGLLTDVSIDRDTQTSSSLAGVDVQVQVSPTGGNQGRLTLSPSANQWVTYDSRFIQISSNLFNALTQACVSGSTTPGFGCFFTFNESTVSAHSYPWIASNLSSGLYTVTVNWKATVQTQGLAEALTCVGPVNLMVAQNKVFNYNQVNSF